ncbi:replication factor C large subunit [Natranaeroarchaeum aerophilus]|uniref:Replication factor C large subunit n=1 Tax=Natranaeroarchaeum aerophilus TaxID=2917711 RepID=A0AAE3FSQ3_9EURY|nr:replication factor C large subunit [Natranaeroarchaeum aerophilus]MCL9814629.1 replication factor C large subunit [Natranaeroarchaeum aerophilus]
MSDWTEKYRPSTLAEVRGNDKARDALKEWADSWEQHREAVIVYGSPGIGKTSAAHALATDKGWPVIELNASDQRQADVIDKIAGEAAQSGTLTQGSSGRRLVVMDEADNFHGNADYGGSAAVTGVVKDADQPMILIANEFYDMSQGLRNACQEIEFRDVSKRSIIPVLRDVCRKEGVEYEDEALEAIAKQTSGDLRSAINDLQAVAERADRLTVDDVVTGQRDTTTDIFDFLDDVIKKLDPQAALEASYDVDETPDDMINWIEDNMPKDYAGRELADAYGYLANADRWLGRVRATQDYSYWRYAGDNMTAGVAAARNEQKGGWTRYGPPSYWSKLGRSRGSRETRDSIAVKIAEESGTSIGTARRHVLPFLAELTHHCKNRELTVRMAAVYDLDEKQVSFVTGSGKTTNKVQSIVEDAQELREQEAVEHSGGAFEGATRDIEDETSEGTESETDVDTEENAGAETEDATETDDAPEEESDDGQAGLTDFM